MREQLRQRIVELTEARRPWRPVARAGESPADGRVEIESRGLDGIHDLWPKDLVARIGAGMTLAACELRLGELGLTLGIEAPLPERSTLGGIFARAEPGGSNPPNQSLRARTLGLSAVDGKARLLKAGARVVKNVAGYDLARLHHGARGAFGMILDLTIRLSARPGAIHHRALSCDAAELRELLQRHRRPQAASDPHRMLWLNRHALRRIGVQGPGLLVVEIHGEAAHLPGEPFAGYAAVRDFAAGGEGRCLALPLGALLPRLAELDAAGCPLRADLLGGVHRVGAELPPEPARRGNAVAGRLKQSFDPYGLLPPLP